MDLIIFRYLNGLAGQNAILDGVIIFFASYLQYLIGLVLVIASIRPIRRYRMVIAGLASGFVARLVVKPLVISFWQRPRPFVGLAGVQQLIHDNNGEELMSFPSGHALLFFALAWAVLFYDRRLGRWFFAGAILMGIARVAAGVHWPSDILAGAILGILSAEIILRLIPLFRRQ
jgi:undecaprenyl-diphosphatase